MKAENRDRIRLLGNMWLFERCDERELDSLVTLVQRLEYSTGKVLAREGEPGREFFVIVSGKAEATRNGALIATFGPGSFFGEMAILEHQPRVATVTIVEPTEVLAMTTAAFEAVTRSMPSVTTKMLTACAGRIRDLETRFLPVGDQVTRNVGG
jgi:CRP-like cAMP-binding protein